MTTRKMPPLSLDTSAAAARREQVQEGEWDKTEDAAEPRQDALWRWCLAGVLALIAVPLMWDLFRTWIVEGFR